MRYSFVISILLLPVSALFAQPGFGPEIGLGMSSMRFAPEIGFTSASSSTIFSGKVGAIGDFHFTKRVYVQPGIFLSRKGQSREFSFYTNDSMNAAAEQTLTINYFDVPVNLLYKTGMQGKGRVILGIGVTASYMIGGKNKLHTHGVDSGAAFNNQSNNLITSDKPLSMFDLGLNLLGGYELPTGLFFRVYYTAGVKDLGRGSEIDKNRMWGISAGYIFGKGRNINKEAGDLIDKSKE